MPKLDADTVDEYQKEWWEWWEGMQPSWRERDTSGKFKAGMYGEDWSELNFAGVNGWLGVAASLFWWGMAIKDGDPHHWQDTLEDTQWMLDGLLGFIN